MPHLREAALRFRNTGGWNGWSRQRVYHISWCTSTGTHNELASGLVPLRKDGIIP